MSGVTGPQDFSGQDPYEETASEGVADAPELGGQLNATFVPTIDDPSRHVKVTVIQSTDDLLHCTRSDGLKVSNR